MFTGIIAEVGRIRSVTRKSGIARFGVEAPGLSNQLFPGDSIAVNGACQTVVEVKDGTIYFESVSETLQRTNLKELKQGSPVNLEPALRLSDRLSGHLVSGHIDATGIVRSKRTQAYRNVDFGVEVPDDLRRFIHPKGSICFDGVSLTVKAINGSMVEVTVIPYTLEKTILKHWRVGTVVNIEVDMLARYLSPRTF